MFAISLYLIDGMFHNYTILFLRHDNWIMFYILKFLFDNWVDIRILDLLFKKFIRCFISQYLPTAVNQQNLVKNKPYVATVKINHQVPQYFYFRLKWSLNFICVFKPIYRIKYLLTIYAIKRYILSWSLSSSSYAFGLKAKRRREGL